MNPTDAVKVALVFLNGFAAFVAAAPGAEIDPTVRVICGGIASACGAALLLLNPPGKPEKFSPKQVDQLTDALLKKTGKAG